MWGQWQFCHSVINTRKTSLSTQEYWINIVHWRFQLSVRFTFKGSNLGSACQKTLPHHTLSLRKEKKFWTKWRLNFIPKCWVQRPWGFTRQKKKTRRPKNDFEWCDLANECLGRPGPQKWRWCWMQHKQKWSRQRTIMLSCDQPLMPPCFDAMNWSMFYPQKV